MAGQLQIPCPGCGLDRTLRFLSLAPDGRFVPDAVPRELELRVRTFSGPGKIACEHVPLPAPFAIGLRDMLRARLAQIEAELAAAGIES